jgi:L-2-hydroxyglutarate oxidase LhgO
MLALQGEAEADGAVISFRTSVVGAKVGSDAAKDGAKVVVETADMALQCDLVVNCAGLAAASVARMFAGEAGAGMFPEQRFAKGNYFGLDKCTALFRHLIYPVPEQHGLGVHATLDLQGVVRFGPDVQWQESSDDYIVDPARADAFYAEIRKYWKGLPDDALVPAYAGIRPKLMTVTGAAADFKFLGPQETGVLAIPLPMLANKYSRTF